MIWPRVSDRTTASFVRKSQKPSPEMEVSVCRTTDVKIILGRGVANQRVDSVIVMRDRKRIFFEAIYFCSRILRDVVRTRREKRCT